jgi:hypothetical protein
MSVCDIWIMNHSVKPWMSSEGWDTYLCEIEQILGDRIVKLDSNDPARRKADTRTGEGSFMVNFGDREDSRWVIGKFEKTKIWFEVRHMKTGLDSFGRLCDNTIQFYIPHRMSFGPDAEKLNRLFALTHQRLGSFFAYADFKDVICSRKPSTPSLDISRELLGVFWLTHFGPAYRAFFGSKLDDVPGLVIDQDGGATVQLGETPAQVPATAREEVIERLGVPSFANGGPPKERGQFALTLHQLADSERLPTPRG